MKPCRGRQGVVGILQPRGAMQIQDFQVLDMLASDRQVVVEARI
jgi:hypothetical protein